MHDFYLTHEREFDRQRSTSHQRRQTMVERLKWVKFTEALNAAGVETGNGRGHWGGIARDGEIVVTSWLNDHKDAGTLRRIHKPSTNHGGLRRLWESGDLKPGTKVKV